MVAQTVSNVITRFDSQGKFWSMTHQSDGWSVLSTINHKAYFVTAGGYFVTSEGDQSTSADPSNRVNTIEEALEVVMLWKLKQAGVTG